MKKASRGSFGKNRYFSLKWSFFLYLPICAAISFAGMFGIGVGTNYLQDWYRAKYTYVDGGDGTKLEIYIDADGVTHEVYSTKITFVDQTHQNVYFLISNAQVILIPLWVFFSITFSRNARISIFSSMAYLSFRGVSGFDADGDL